MGSEKILAIVEYDEQDLREVIRLCQEQNHVQQVAFSTYHNALTQVCFTCNKVRTSIKLKELEAKEVQDE